MELLAYHLELWGFCIAVYGVLREAFRVLSERRPYGEGRYGEGAYDRSTAIVFGLGKILHLLPRGGTETYHDRIRHTLIALVGVLLLFASIALRGVVLYRNS